MGFGEGAACGGEGVASQGGHDAGSAFFGFSSFSCPPFRESCSFFFVVAFEGRRVTVLTGSGFYCLPFFPFFDGLPFPFSFGGSFGPLPACFQESLR